MNGVLDRGTRAFAGLVLAAGCETSTPPSDATSDRPVDAAFACPDGSLDPTFSRPCLVLEGTECRYGYTVPGCGGRTQSCVGGHWTEVHTDPSSTCFDAGRD